MALLIAEVMGATGEIEPAIAQKLTADRDLATSCNPTTLLSSASHGIGLTIGKPELARNFSQSENYQGRCYVIDTFSR